MAAATPPTDQQHAYSRRPQSWLIPSNRKLRHLHGLALRNLALSQAPPPDHDRIVDDDVLPTSLKTPAKLLALRQGKQLGHSRSSNDLRPIHESAMSDSDAEPTRQNGTPKQETKRTAKRPAFAKLRRRSTMEWAVSSPQQRQQKLEDVSASRLADVFFSLHVSGITDAIYVSEIAEKTMNPNFRHIDLDGCGPGITRADSVTIKFWTKSEKMEQYRVFIEVSLNFRSLQFIGKELASFSHPFPQNCIIFQLTDGYYTCFTDAQVEESANPFVAQSNTTSTRMLPTSSFDALLRLSKLDDSIQDALALRSQLASDLDRITQRNNTALVDRDRVAEADDFLKTINYAKATVEKQLRNLQKSREQKQLSLQKRRELLTRGRQDRIEGLHEVKTGGTELESIRNQRGILNSSIAQQRRRICEDVQKIYPISPLPDRALAFNIRALHLPNSNDLDASSNDTVAAALGHVAHVVQLLSFYLSQPLPYSIQPRSSTSTIIDPISTTIASTTTTTTTTTGGASPKADPARVFPLFTRGTVRYRFEYAVFLLNKDIELLLSASFHVRVLDIRHTLPNLLYVLYCATAGEGELPARKAGGVRGLLRDSGGRSACTTGGASMPAGGEDVGDGKGLLLENEGAIGSLRRNKEVQARKMGAS